MLVTTRAFENTAELKQMIKGFEMLFNATPETRIIVNGRHGNPTGVDCIDGGELWFRHDGYKLLHVGTKVLTVETIEPAQPVSFSIPKNQENFTITFHAAFYLP